MIQVALNETNGNIAYLIASTSSELYTASQHIGLGDSYSLDLYPLPHYRITKGQAEMLVDAGMAKWITMEEFMAEAEAWMSNIDPRKMLNLVKNQQPEPPKPAPPTITPDKWKPYDREAFIKELESLLNRYGIDTKSDTPDFMLANHLTDYIDLFCWTAKQRDHWGGMS